MSFGSRLYQIFRAPVDLGAQTTDLFIDTIRLATDEEYSTFEAFNESWKDNVLGKMSASNEYVAGRSMLGSVFGPDSGLGAIVGAVPENVRERPAAVWNTTMDGYTYAFKNFVDRPIGTMISMASIDPWDARDPITGMRTGRGFNTKFFEFDTWKNVWDLTDNRSAGQAIMMFAGHVDLYNPVSVDEFKQTPKYQLVSGIFDLGINIGGDPGFLIAKTARFARNVRHAKSQHARGNPAPFWPEEVVDYIDIDGSGNPTPMMRVQPGLMPNEGAGPFNQKLRPPVVNKPILVRTPNREPIRIGGQKLHEKILAFEGQYPRLERLLGGSVTDMLTIGGGKVIGTSRTADDLLWENWSYQPKWMDDLPNPSDVIDADLVPITKELQQIVIEETNKLAIQGIRPTATYLNTGDIGAAPQFGPNLNAGGPVPAIEIASRRGTLGETDQFFGTSRAIEDFLGEELGDGGVDPFPYSLAEGGVVPVTAEVRTNYIGYKAAYENYDADVFSELMEDPVIGPLLEDELKVGPAEWRGRLEDVGPTEEYGLSWNADEYARVKRTFEEYLYNHMTPLERGQTVDANVDSAIERVNNELVEATQKAKAAEETRDAWPLGPEDDPDTWRRLNDEVDALRDLAIPQLMNQRLELQLYRAHVEHVFYPLETLRNSLHTMEHKVPDVDLDKFYGTGLWKVDSNTAFHEIVALRIYQKMPQWGPAFTHMTPEDRWQLSRVYATLANAAPIDSSAWLPFHNFQRYMAGNIEVKKAVHEQIKEVVHLWSLLRRIPGPVRDPYGRFPDEFDYDWRRTIGEMDEVPGPMAELPAILERPTSIHWHFAELGRVRREIASFDQYRRNMDVVTQSMADDPALMGPRSDLLGGTGTAQSIDKLDRVHVNHILDVLRQKEKAHAIFIQHYLFSPQALTDMSIQAAQQELIQALEEMGLFDEAENLGVDVADLPGAREAILDYEKRRRLWDDPTKEGIEKFRTMPVKPLDLDAADILLGNAGDSEFAEFIDRMYEMQNMPINAFLAEGEATYKNLVQDIYSKLPANHDIYNPELIVRGTEDISSPGELHSGLTDREGLERLRAHENISPREMHELAVDNLLETINLEVPRTIEGFNSILKPTTKPSLWAKTFFEKSGIHAGFTNSRAFKFYSEKVLEGVIDVNNKNQVITELEKFFRDLDRINVSDLMQKHHGQPSLLASGEPLSMLDVALMTYRSDLTSFEAIGSTLRPDSKDVSQLWADQLLIELVDTRPEQLGGKLDRLIGGVLTGFVEAIIPDKKFDGIDWGGPDVRQNLVTLLRGELKAVKQMLEEGGEATGKRYGNVDFTDILGTDELGTTTFIRKPISPRQTRQAVIMPRIDRWKELERALTGDWKTIDVAGKLVQVGMTPVRAAIRNGLMEGQSMWKTITLLTPRWPMVVNTDSQLRLHAAVDSSLALAALGPAFDTLQVRWLRNNGIDVHAIVQNDLFEELGGFERIDEIAEDIAELQTEPSLLDFSDNDFNKLMHERTVLENREFIEMVDLYMDRGGDMVDFVAQVMDREYTVRRKTLKVGTATALGLYFTGPVGAVAAAGAYTAHSRVSIQKAARRQVAESYGIAARNAAWVSLREAESVDIFNWLAEHYPNRYEHLEAAYIGSDVGYRAFPDEIWADKAGTTEAAMYADVLRDSNMLNPEDVALWVNTRVGFEIIVDIADASRSGTLPSSRDEWWVSVDTFKNTEFYANASSATLKVIDARLKELERPLSERERNWFVEEYPGDPEALDGEFRVIGLEDVYGFPIDGLDIPPTSEVSFITPEQAQRLIGDNLSLVDLAKEFNQALKNRRRAAEMISQNVTAVNDYERTIVQGFATQFPQLASRFERASQILIEGGFSTTQVGSTRIDNAFGDTPQIQEINRRNISANPTARTQLLGGTHIQRKRQQYQGAHQYDITSRQERESFVNAWDDYLDRYVVPFGKAGDTATRDYWRQFFRGPDQFRGPAEILDWLRTYGQDVLDQFVESYRTTDQLEGLISDSRYEANSLVPTMLPGFEPVIKKVQAGTVVKWNADILPALQTLQAEVDLFWSSVIKGFLDDAELRRERGLQETGSISVGSEMPEWDTMETLWDNFENRGVTFLGSYNLGDESLLRLGPDGTGFSVSAPLRRLVLSSYKKIVDEVIGSTGNPIFSMDNRIKLMRLAAERPIVEQIRLMGENTEFFREQQNTASYFWGTRMDQLNAVEAAGETVYRGEEGLRDFGKTVNSSQFLDAKQTGTIWQRIKEKVAGPLETLGEVESVMSRGVMFDALYGTDVLRRLEPFRVDGVIRISPKALSQLQEKSRKYATEETKNQLYDLASRTRIEETLWLASPFFGAWQEVIGRWFSLATENPVFVARGLRAFATASAEDENGQTVLVMQLPDIFEYRTEAEWLPFIESIDWFGDIEMLAQMPLDWKLGSASFFSAFPSGSPIISWGIGEAILKVPELDKTLGWLIPYGIAEGDDAFTRMVSSLIPAWTKNLARKGVGELYLDDERRQATAARVLIDMMVQYNEQGLKLPTTNEAKKDFLAEAERRTTMIYGIRAIRNLAIPTSAIQQSPYYPILQEYWRVMEEHGPEVADEYILANHQDLWPATARTSLTIEAVAGTRQGHANYETHKADATEYLEIAPWIIGQVGPEEVKWEYNRNIRRLEKLEGRTRPLTLNEQFMDATASEGWREWKDYRIKLYAKLAQRKKAGLSGAISSHYDLVQERRAFVYNLGRQYPSWAQEFSRMGDAQTVSKVLAGFRHVVEDPAYEKRLDVVQIQRYLKLHDDIALALEDRARVFNNSKWERLGYRENEDLLVRWQLGIAQLLLEPDFGNVYDRFFSNIDTVSVSNSPLREPATLGSAR